jgi:hypothetical protein
MTPEEKRMLIELAIITMSESSPDAQRRISNLLDAMEDADRAKEFGERDAEQRFNDDPHRHQ